MHCYRGMGQLGTQYAKALWERGARVAVWGRHVASEKVAKTFTQEQISSGRMKFYAVDISSKQSLNDALDAMRKEWDGAPDVLVNNAGIDTQPSAPPEVSGPFENFLRRCSARWWISILWARSWRARP